MGPEFDCAVSDRTKIPDAHAAQNQAIPLTSSSITISQDRDTGVYTQLQIEVLVSDFGCCMPGAENWQGPGAQL